MEGESRIKTGFAVFDNPLNFKDTTVYGVLIHKDTTIPPDKVYHYLSSYMEYLTVKSILCRTKKEDENGFAWVAPNSKTKFSGDENSLCHLGLFFVKDLVKFKVYEFDRPIHWKPEEVSPHVPSLIVDYSLIDRYLNDATFTSPG